VILDQASATPATSAAAVTGEPATPRRRRRPNVLFELIIVVLLIKVYDLIRSLAAVRAAPAHRHGAQTLNLERALHLNWELTLNRWLTDHQPLAVFAVYWYQFAHIGVTLAVLVWCYIAGPRLYRPVRNALVITNLTGMTVYFLLPVAPPRLLANAGFTDTVAEAGFGATHGGPVPADQYAAMPSLHLAWAVWTAYVAASLLRGRSVGPVRRLAYLYPVITGTVVVVTANHFVLDVVAGVAVGVGAIAAARILPARLPQMIRRRTSTASTSALGSSGSQTVIRRYPSTAPSATAEETPTAARPAASVTSSAPSPPGEGTMADSDETIR
jgi:membrane-associated phospholipid phosphatase